MRRWSEKTVPIDLLVAGMVLWFLLTRVWTDWLPVWTKWTRPASFLPPVGWIIFLAPIGLWLWLQGQIRWPVLFFTLNLLVFGGLLGLIAFHTESSWIDIWHSLTKDTAIQSFPILIISISPAALWSWNWASRRWNQIFAIPNRLLTGGILWLVLDQTRFLWTGMWQVFWGEVPAKPDLAILMLVLPLAAWLWLQANDKWPHTWKMMWALLLGAVLWWLLERSRARWEYSWWGIAGRDVPDLAVLAGLTPPLLWMSIQLRQRQPRILAVVIYAIGSVGLYWLAGRLMPNAITALRVVVALLPSMMWGWGQLLRQRPRIGWILLFIYVLVLGILIWFGFTVT